MCETVHGGILHHELGYGVEQIGPLERLFGFVRCPDKYLGDSGEAV
jgi:hypothetical protein